MIAVDKCIKKAGLIQRARTYRLELHPEGLYVLCLGNATGEFRKFRSYTLEKYMAERALSYFSQKYDQEHEAALNELKLLGLPAFANRKHTYFLPAQSLNSALSLNTQKGFMQIRDPLCKLKLYPKTMEDYHQLEKLMSELGSTS